MKVRDVMTRLVVTAMPDTPFAELVDRMVRHGIGALPIVGDSGQLIGIVTDADLVSKEAYGGQPRRTIEVLADLVAGGRTRWAIKAQGRTAGELMTTVVHTADPTDDIRTAARRMVEEGIKHLPVVERGRLVGMLSRTDLLRVLHRGDDVIAADVAALVGANPPGSGGTVRARVAGGIVTLRGTVPSLQNSAALAASVWAVPGVVDVRNEVLAVEPDTRLAG